MVSSIVSTRAVCHNTPRQLLLVQSGQGMECASRLERAYALVIFALEEKVDGRSGGSLSFECRSY